MPLQLLDLSQRTGAQVTYTFKHDTTVNIDSGGMEYRYPNLYGHQLEINVKDFFLKTSNQVLCDSPYTKEQFLAFFDSVKGTETPFLVRCWIDYQANRLPLYNLNARSNNNTFSLGVIQGVPNNPTRYRFVKGYRHSDVWGWKSLFRMEQITNVYDQAGVLINPAHYSLWNIGTNDNGILNGSYLERNGTMPGGTIPSSFDGTFYYFVRFKDASITINQVSQDLFKIDNFVLTTHVEAEAFDFNDSDYPRQLTGTTRTIALAEDLVQSATVFPSSTTKGKPFQTYTYGYRNEYTEAESTKVKAVKARTRDNTITVNSKAISGLETQLLLTQFIANKGKLLPFNYPYGGLGSTTLPCRFDTDELDFTINRIDESDACKALVTVDRLAFRCFDTTIAPYLPPEPVYTDYIYSYDMNNRTTTTLTPISETFSGKTTRTGVNITVNTTPSITDMLDGRTSGMVNIPAWNRSTGGLTTLTSSGGTFVPNTNTEVLDSLYIIHTAISYQGVIGSPTNNSFKFTPVYAVLTSNLGQLARFSYNFREIRFQIGSLAERIVPNTQGVGNNWTVAGIYIRAGILYTVMARTIPFVRTLEATNSYSSASGENFGFSEFVTNSIVLTTAEKAHLNQVHHSINLTTQPTSFTVLDAASGLQTKQIEVAFNPNFTIDVFRSRVATLGNRHHTGVTTQVNPTSLATTTRVVAPAPSGFAVVFRADTTSTPASGVFTCNNIVGSTTFGNFALNYNGTVGQPIFRRATPANNTTTLSQSSAGGYGASQPTNSRLLRIPDNSPLFTRFGTGNEVSKLWDNTPYYYESFYYVVAISNNAITDSLVTQFTFPMSHENMLTPTNILHNGGGGIQAIYAPKMYNVTYRVATAGQQLDLLYGASRKPSLSTSTSFERYRTNGLVTLASGNRLHFVFGMYYNRNLHAGDSAHVIYSSRKFESSVSTLNGIVNLGEIGLSQNSDAETPQYAYAVGAKPFIYQPVAMVMTGSSGSRGLSYMEVGANQNMTTAEWVSHFTTISTTILG